MLNRKRKTEEELVNELKIRAEKVEQVVTNLVLVIRCTFACILYLIENKI